MLCIQKKFQNLYKEKQFPKSREMTALHLKKLTGFGTGSPETFSEEKAHLKWESSGMASDFGHILVALKLSKQGGMREGLTHQTAS